MRHLFKLKRVILLLVILCLPGPMLFAKEIRHDDRPRCFEISIGINVPSCYSFRPSYTFLEADAARFSAFFKEQFKWVNQESPLGYDSTLMYTIQLTNKGVTKKNVDSAFAFVQQNAREGDYFIFNLSGEAQSFNGVTGTSSYFLTGDASPCDSASIVSKGISMDVLKGWLEYVPARNQLIIMEVGDSKKIGNELLSKLVEGNSVVASLLTRNRIIIFPNGQRRQCRLAASEGSGLQGLLNYCISSLPDTLNFFKIFDEDPKQAEVVKYNILQKELSLAGANEWIGAYCKIKFEREIINDYTFYFKPRENLSRGAWLEAESPPLVGGKNYALVIGTDSYVPNSGWSKLSNAESDARDLAVLLDTSYDFETQLILHPSLDSIYGALLRYRDVLDSNDQFLIYISGHGDYDGRFNDGYLVCSDTKNRSADPFRRSYLPYSILNSLVAALPAKHVLLILDVCFGGTFDPDIAAQETRGNAPVIYPGLTPQEFFRNTLKYRSRFYLTSGGKNTVPDGYHGLHSPFAYKLLEVLRNCEFAHRMLIAGELYSYVKELRSGPVFGRFGKNEPGGEFVFIPK